MLDVVVESIEDETERVRLFTLRAASSSQLPDYAAGAHIEVYLNSNLSRAYSLIDFSTTTAPRKRYQVAVQREEQGQGGSQLMHALSVGDSLRCSTPKNSFALTDNNNTAVLLAGGIGVTPLISMATTLAHQDRPFQFHYAARDRQSMAFRQQLEKQFGRRMMFHCDNDESKLNLDHLLSRCDSNAELYICGPKGLIDAARQNAETRGFEPTSIHVELFTTPATTTVTGSFEVELKQSGQVFLVPPDKSIIDVLEAAGVDLIYDCQRGDCGICQTDVIAGDVDHRDVVLSEAERRSGKVMQICVSRAKSARLVLDL